MKIKHSGAHDVVSIANLAKQCNEYNELQKEAKYSKNSRYITVSTSDSVSFEKATEQDYMNFIKENSYKVINGNVNQIVQLFKCSKIEFNERGWVNYIRIVNN